MNVLYCALVVIHTMTPMTPLDVKRVDLAYAICKQAKESNGCLERYRKYKNIALIKCGKR